MANRARRSLRAVTGLLVCAVAALGLLFQAGVLATTAGKGFKPELRERGTLLDAAARVVPPGATVGSNLYAAGYALYPRRVVGLQLTVSGQTFRAELRRAGVRYLVLAHPLPPSMGDAGTWTRLLYQDRHGTVLEVR